MGFAALDYIVIVIYLAGVAVVGLILSGKQRSNKEYFLGGKEIPWWAVLFSIVATETSTLTFISIPAVAYGGNLTFLQITVGYLIGRILVALFFLPQYFKGELQTAYSFLEQRFGPSMRNAASSIFMITRLLADGVRLFATAIPLAVILRMGGAFTGFSDLELYAISIMMILLITLVYTYLGGIKAVVWMDFIQMLVYIGGALLAAFIMINGLPDSFSIPGEKLKLLDLGFDMSFREFIAQPYTLLTALVGGAVFSLASHGTDHLIIQRVLATGDLKSGQKAMVWSGIVAAIQFAIFMGVGLLLYAFYRGLSASELGLSTTDEIFALFIVSELPAGISGLIIAALFAAAMSSLSSSLNSLASSTMFDIYKPYFGIENTEQQDLKISRFITLCWGLILGVSAMIFAILQLKEGEQPAIVELGLGIASYTYGGLLGAFLLGLFFKLPNGKDAMIGLITGLIMLLFIVDGPISNILPGSAWTIGWPLYTLVGSFVVVIVGYGSGIIRKRINDRNA